MIGGIVIESPTGGRAVVAPDALDQWLVRGFEAKGPAAPDAEGDTPQTTDEWASELARREAVIVAALAPKTSAPKRSNQQKG